MFLPICFPNFVYEFFTASAVEKPNKFLIHPKQVLFSVCQLKIFIKKIEDSDKKLVKPSLIMKRIIQLVFYEKVWTHTNGDFTYLGLLQKHRGLGHRRFTAQSVVFTWCLGGISTSYYFS